MRPREEYLINAAPTRADLPGDHIAVRNPSGGLVVNGYKVRELTDAFLLKNPHYHPVNQSVWGIEIVHPPYEDIPQPQFSWPPAAFVVPGYKCNRSALAVFARATLQEDGSILLGPCYAHFAHGNSAQCLYRSKVLPIINPRGVPPATPQPEPPKLSMPSPAIHPGPGLISPTAAIPPALSTVCQSVDPRFTRLPAEATAALHMSPTPSVVARPVESGADPTASALAQPVTTPSPAVARLLAELRAPTPLTVKTEPAVQPDSVDSIKIRELEGALSSRDRRIHELEMALSTKDLELKAVLSASGVEQESRAAKIRELEASLASSRNELEACSAAVRDLQDTVSSRDQQLHILTERIGKLEQTLSSTDRELQSRAATISTLEQTLASKDNELEKRSTPVRELEIYAAKTRKLEADLASSGQQMKDTIAIQDRELGKHMATVRDLKDTVSSKDRELQARAETMSKLEHTLASKDHELEQRSTRIRELERYAIKIQKFEADLVSGNQQMKDTIATKDRQLGQHLATIRDLKNTVASKDRALQTGASTISKLQQALSSKDRELEQRSTRILELESYAAKARTLDAILVSRGRELETLTTELRGVRDTVASKDSELQNRAATINKLEETLSTRNTEIGGLSIKNRDLEQAITAKDTELRCIVAAHQSEMRELEDSKGDLKAAIAEKEGEIKTAIALKDQELERIRSLSTRRRDERDDYALCLKMIPNYWHDARFRKDYRRSVQLGWTISKKLLDDLALKAPQDETTVEEDEDGRKRKKARVGDVDV